MNKKIPAIIIAPFIILVLISFVSAEFWACLSKGQILDFCNPKTPDRTCGSSYGCDAYGCRVGRRNAFGYGPGKVLRPSGYRPGDVHTPRRGYGAIRGHHLRRYRIWLDACHARQNRRSEVEICGRG